MALFEVTANDKRIYEEELKDFLPDKIFDIHCHVALREHTPKVEVKPGEKRTVTWPSLVADQNSIENLKETYELFFPGKDCKAMFFSNAGHGEAVNDYCAKVSKESGWPALYYSHPEQSADEIEQKITSQKIQISALYEQQLQFANQRELTQNEIDKKKTEYRRLKREYAARVKYEDDAKRKKK